MPRNEVFDLIDLAPHRDGFPAIIELPHETLGECCIDPAASTAFHEFAERGMFDLRNDLLTPVSGQCSPQPDSSHCLPLEEHCGIIVGVGLTIFDRLAPVSDSYIWFLLNRPMSGRTGLAVPAARRVNGSPYNLEPLAMPLTPATYAANVAITYGSELLGAFDNEY